MGTLIAAALVSAGALTAPQGARTAPALFRWTPLRGETAAAATQADSLVDALYDSLAALERRMPPAASGPAALGRTLGPDPERVYEFVRDSIAYEPYEGVLRGAAGALSARAGNACDQALLLRDLLAVHGVRANVHVAPLDGGARAALVALARQAARRRPPDSDVPLGGALRRDVEAVFADVARRAPAAFEGPSGAGDAGRALRTHCWAELEAPQRRVLDPVLPRPLRLRSAGRAVEGMPEELRWKLGLRVLLRHGDGGAAADDVVLQRATFATDSLGVDPVVLSIVPAPADRLDSLAAGGDPGVVLEGFRSFHPVLELRGTHVVGDGFTLTGDVAAADGAPLPGGEAVGGRLGDMLGGGRIGGLEAPRDTTPPRGAPDELARLPTVLLEYRLEGPGSRRHTIIRTLVTGGPLEPGDRPALEVLQRRALLVSTSPVGQWTILEKLIDVLRRNRSSVEAVAARRLQAAPPAQRYPFELLGLAGALDEAARLLAWSSDAELFRGEPGLLSLNEGFSTAGALPSRVVRIDVLRTGFMTLSATSAARGLLARLGIYASLLEERALGRGATGFFELAARAERRGIPFVVLQGQPSARTVDAALPPATKAALLADLGAGYVLIAPAAPLESTRSPGFGWWRLDPRTGEVLGVLESGEGGAQAGTELTLTKAVVVGAVIGGSYMYLTCYFWQGGGAVRCWTAAVCGAVLGGLTGGIGWAFAPTLGGAIAGGALSGLAGFAADPCDTPRHDPSDNDGDGDPNDTDPNDDCPRCDPDNPPPNNRNDDEDEDDDNDDVPDEEDDLPSDDSEHTDTDGDGTGDNADTDDDGDGVPDDCGAFNQRCGPGEQDDFPRDPNESRDRDGDGIGDNADDFQDVDRDGLEDGQDDCLWCRDSDGDGDPDRSDPDVDGDGRPNSSDARPEDPRTAGDADEDGLDDVYDPDPETPAEVHGPQLDCPDGADETVPGCGG